MLTILISQEVDSESSNKMGKSGSAQDDAAVASSPEPDSQDSQVSTFMHGIGGMISSQFSLAVIYPIDQLRLYLQVSETQSAADKNFLDFFRERSLGEIYRGLIPTLQAVGVSCFVYFSLYNYFKKVYLFFLIWTSLRSQSDTNMVNLFSSVYSTNFINQH